MENVLVSQGVSRRKSKIRGSLFLAENHQRFEGAERGSGWLEQVSFPDTAKTHNVTFPAETGRLLTTVSGFSTLRHVGGPWNPLPLLCV